RDKGINQRQMITGRGSTSTRGLSKEEINLRKLAKPSLDTGKEPCLIIFSVSSMTQKLKEFLDISMPM
ncbi:hypothetical protein, partial [Hydrogenivirga sp. 128-5-R1-1]|uniref:hypothetical protein n=1 Tax=Hydrogenivirga sp. 128-5-R1-1 TaxID=392423 RepID=UPI001E4319D3